jgi:D-lactate dehydrogenase
LAGAALDVVENEYLLDPDEIIDLAAENTGARSSLRHALALLALERMPNVIITNHNAFNTTEAIDRINTMVVKNILGFYDDSEIHIV